MSRMADLAGQLEQEQLDRECEESNYVITLFGVGDEMKYAVSVKHGGFLAYCNYASSALAVRDDAIRRARIKLNGGK